MKARLKRGVLCSLLIVVCVLMLSIYYASEVSAATVPDRAVISKLNSQLSGVIHIESKQDKTVTGFQIKYSRNSDFSNSKTLKIKGIKLKKDITGLAAWKAYYVKIRAYKTTKTKTLYGRWSYHKKIVTHKYCYRYILSYKQKLYSKPDSKSSSVNSWYMDKVKVLGTAKTYSTGTWKKVVYKSKVRYLWVPNNSKKLTATKKTFSYTDNSSAIVKEVIAEAFRIKKLDTEYRSTNIGKSVNGKYGYNSPGFVASVLNKVVQKRTPVYKVSTNLKNQYTTEALFNEGYAEEFKVKTVCTGKPDYSLMKPGDIVFFGKNQNNVNHSGIYIGSNEFIHSDSAYDGVCVFPLTDYYKSTFICAKRFIPTTFKELGIKKTALKQLTVYEKSACSVSTPKITLWGTSDVTILYTRAANKDSSHDIAYISYKDIWGNRGKGFLSDYDIDGKLGDKPEQQLKYSAHIRTYLHTEPNSESDDVSIWYNTPVTILGTAAQYSNGISWLKVKVDDEIGYLRVTADNEMFSDVENPYTGYVNDGNSDFQNEILTEALRIWKEWDTVYDTEHNKSDGTFNKDGTVSFDCSGFTAYVYNKLFEQYNPLLKIVGNTDWIYNSETVYNKESDTPYRPKFIGKKLDEVELLPGDIILFWTEGGDQGHLNANHCAIYLGDNQIIHSTGSYDGVSIVPLIDGLPENVVGVVRLLTDDLPIEPMNLEYTLTGTLYLHEVSLCPANDPNVVKLPKGSNIKLLYTRNYDDGAPGYAYISYIDDEGKEQFGFAYNYEVDLY